MRVQLIPGAWKEESIGMIPYYLILQPRLR